jgi:protein-S-isoprenylcysteine O-methyltransferase Ste14
LQPLPFVNTGAGLAFSIAVGLFAVLQLTSSVVSGVRAKRSMARHVRLDRWSLPFIVLCAGGGVLGASASATHVTSAAVAPGIPALRWLLFGLGVAMVVTGSAVRLWAITTLGRWFTYDVRVTEGQPVIQTGPYRRVRHPSYTGVLLVLFGIGLTLGNWLSLLIIVILPTLGLVRRIRVEEAALLGTIGEPYERYAAGRSRLFPGLW